MWRSKFAFIVFMNDISSLIKSKVKSFRFWSLVKLFSVYAHSSIEASFKKSSWNSSHNQPPWFDPHTAGTQFKLTTTSTKHLFPAERSLLKLQSKQTRQTNNFSALFWGGFFSSTWRSPQTSWDAFSPTRGMVYAMSHVILASQSYCWVNDLGGKIPVASTGSTQSFSFLYLLSSYSTRLCDPCV